MIPFLGNILNREDQRSPGAGGGEWAVGAEKVLELGKINVSLGNCSQLLVKDSVLHCGKSTCSPRVCLLSGSSGDEPLGGKFRKLSLGQYDNDAGGQPAFSRCGWGKTPSADQATGLASFLSPTDAKEVGTIPW